jgi:hypothetical protein
LLSPEPTRAEVDYLIREKKFIRSMPAMVTDRYEYRVQAEVRKISNPGEALGLVIYARAKRSPSGVPKGLPSAALMWRGYRIRGLNKELWHDNPEGSTVQGWHEHIWTNEWHDSHVIAARPKPRDLSLRGVLEWAMGKWNITVRQSQLKVK